MMMQPQQQRPTGQRVFQARMRPQLQQPAQPAYGSAVPDMSNDMGMQEQQRAAQSPQQYAPRPAPPMRARRPQRPDDGTMTNQQGAGFQRGGGVVEAPKSVVTGQPLVSQPYQSGADGPATDGGAIVNATAPLPNAMSGQPAAVGASPRVFRGRAAGSPALDARPIGSMGGKQRFVGADGRLYTNQDRANAIEQRDAANANTMEDRWWDAMDDDQMREAESGDLLRGGIGRMQEATRGVQSWRPTNTQGFDPSRLENMRATNTEGTRPTWQEGWSSGSLDNFRSGATEGVDTSALDNYNPSALGRVNSGRVANFDAGGTMQSYLNRTGGGGPIDVVAGQANFDPTEAVNTYARGAAGQARFVLEDALEQAANSAAAGGRLDSGLFDKDRGSVISRVGADLNNQIATRAVDAAQIRANLESGNAQNATQAAIARGNLAGDQQALRSAEARDASRLGLDALTTALNSDFDVANASDDLRLRGATNATDARLRRASTIDNNALTATEAASRLNLTRAQGVDDANARRSEYLDTFGRDNTRDTLEMQQRRGEFLDSSTLDQLVASGNMTRAEAELYQRMNEDNITRSRDTIASERDRITANQNFRTQQTFNNRQSNRAFWGGLAGTAIGAGAAAYGGGR